MKAIFKEINDINNVHATLFFSFEGSLLFFESSKDLGFKNEDIQEFANTMNWKEINAKFRNIHEAELLFAKYRVYVRKADSGYLLAVMGLMAPVEVVRLNVDLLMPQLNTIKKSTGLGRFFKFRS